jgi:hypothetical protein
MNQYPHLQQVETHPLMIINKMMKVLDRMENKKLAPIYLTTNILILTEVFKCD